jgi:hypothetical protein
MVNIVNNIIKFGPVTIKGLNNMFSTITIRNSKQILIKKLYRTLLIKLILFTGKIDINNAYPGIKSNKTENRSFKIGIPKLKNGKFTVIVHKVIIKMIKISI